MKPDSKTTRDEFPMRIKRAVASRVAQLCSNPECSAATAGPQSNPEESVNIGVAAHISAAAPGGPRYNPRLTPQERSAAANAIWLCQNCAKLIDTDVVRFSEAVLLKWKRDAELEAKHKLGKTHTYRRPKAATLVQKKLALKRKMHKDFADSWQGRELLIRSIEDQSYPNMEEGQPGISPWFTTEFWNFYHNGIQVVLSIEYAIVAPDGRWAVVPTELQQEVARDGFGVNIFYLGRIPFRNIVDYEMNGDEYYGGPHIYCQFADGGTPYEGFAAETPSDAVHRMWFSTEKRVRFADLIGESADATEKP